MALSNQRVAWFNGNIVPEQEAVIPFRDASFRRGDGAFDMTRTFEGRIFKLKEHLDRFYRSLRYLRIDPGVSQEEMHRITEEVVEKNRHLLGADDDYWVEQRVSRGVDAVGDEGWEHTGPQVIVACMPLPLKKRAIHFRDGISVIVPSTRRTPPDALTPRAKTHNYLNLVMADHEVKAQNPDAWSVLLGQDGNLTEGIGSNIFLVRDGVISTPRERFVLPGVSRQTVIDLARQEGFTVVEEDIDLYDAYNADEIFLTSTSLCICPVSDLNGMKFVNGGPVTNRLTEAYKRYVNHDFVAQYLKRLT